MSISIDEMIRAGKTLPEIQAELRKQVASRDEEALQNAKYEQAKKNARTKAAAALTEYFKILGIPDDACVDLDEDLFSTFETSIEPLLKAAASPKVTIETKPVTKDDLEWLREFIASL